VTSLAVRALLVVLAAFVLAWLALGLRAVRLEDQAQATIDRARAGPVTDLDVAQARDHLTEARRLSPDKGPAIREGQLLDAAGRKAEADFIGRSLVSQEPDNLQAWFLAWVAAGDEQWKHQSLTHLRRLNPYIDIALGLRDCLDCPLKKR
jgi:hypothetical protein